MGTGTVVRIGIDVDDLFSLSSSSENTQQTPLPLNPTPEQAFLAKNYDENPGRADRDPRDLPLQTHLRPSLISPISSSSSSLQTAERALAEMEERQHERYS